MNICRISATLPPVLGGLEQHVAELSCRQAQQGHCVHLIFANGETSEADGIIGHRIAMPATRKGERSTLRKFRFMRRAWPTLWGLARRREVDVIDAHGDFVEGFFVGLIGKLTRTPTVLTVHGGLNARPLARWASRLSFSLLTHLVAVSEYIRSQLHERGVSSSKISVISGGVDLSMFLPGYTIGKDVVRETHDNPMILYVGRLQPVKGVDVLLKAARNVKERFPKALFVIAGSGPEEPKLRQAADGQPNVQFAGEVSRDEVANLMRRASILVQPSIVLPGQTEGQSRAVMEAMASGLPIVASRTGGITELFEDGKGGRFVKPGDVQALADALVEVMSDPTAAREMGRHNSDRVKERDFGIIEQKVSALFERLVARGKTS